MAHKVGSGSILQDSGKIFSKSLIFVIFLHSHQQCMIFFYLAFRSPFKLCIFSVCNSKSLFFSCLQDLLFFFPLVFSSLSMIIWGVIFFEFILFGIHEVIGLVNDVFNQIWKVFRQYFFKYNFCFHLFLLSL